MVIRIGNSFYIGDKLIGGGKAVSLKDFIRRCQGLAKAWPWQPLKDLL